MISLAENLSLENYFQLEEETYTRHEYVDGEVRAIAGTTLEHDFISNNLIELLKNCLREKGYF